MRKLQRDFFNRPTVTVAKELLGKKLVRVLPDGKSVAGCIVETEAYIGGEDLASHSSKGLTRSNAVMFGPAGYAYIYLVYGMHHCLNFVTESEGRGAAVLIRAIENGTDPGLTNGPGKLTKHLKLTREENGINLTGGKLFILDQKSAPWREIVAAPRIGVSYAGQWALKPWRFYIKDNPFVSKTSLKGRRPFERRPSFRPMSGRSALPRP